MANAGADDKNTRHCFILALIHDISSATRNFKVVCWSTFLLCHCQKYTLSAQREWLIYILKDIFYSWTWYEELEMHRNGLSFQKQVQTFHPVLMICTCLQLRLTFVKQGSLKVFGQEKKITKFWLQLIVVESKQPFIQCVVFFHWFFLVYWGAIASASLQCNVLQCVFDTKNKPYVKKEFSFRISASTQTVYGNVSLIFGCVFVSHLLLYYNVWGERFFFAVLGLNLSVNLLQNCLVLQRQFSFLAAKSNMTFPDWWQITR